MNIAERISNLKQSIPDHVTLIAVSKMQPVDRMLEVYHAGIHHFGENKVQEVIRKAPVMPADVIWHFIGHLQTNKVKNIVPLVGMIHSLDRISLMKEIQREALKHGRIIDCLLQFHIAKEETKFGMDPEEAGILLEEYFQNQYPNIRIAGVMGMASFTDDPAVISSEFRELQHIFTHIKNRYFRSEEHFRHLSMGMSGDYALAIEAGSTMVRIGTSIFGERL